MTGALANASALTDVVSESRAAKPSAESVVCAVPDGPEVLAHRALRAGDQPAALTILMEAYGQEIFRHCRHVVGCSDLAADVHQTVFVQAYRDLASFGNRSSYRTWLFAIARNRCLDALKAHRRRGLRFLLGMTVADRPDPTPTAQEQLHQHTQTVAMDRALERLKPEVRIAVLLRYREEMSFEEMAQVCGERPATLQARVARALPKLRRALERQGQ